PDTFVRTTLPGMRNASAIVHIGPVLGAAFTEYTAECEPKGEWGDTPAQRFVYVMDGAVTVEVKGKRHELGERGYAYLPEGFSHRVVAKEKSRVAIIEKQYEKNEKTEPPRLLVSNEDAVSSHALDGDSDLQVKCLLPDEPQFNFAVNTMVYQPGAALSMVEMHVMEQGLIMIEDGGDTWVGVLWCMVRDGEYRCVRWL